MRRFSVFGRRVGMRPAQECWRTAKAAKYTKNLKPKKNYEHKETFGESRGGDRSIQGNWSGHRQTPRGGRRGRRGQLLRQQGWGRAGGQRSDRVSRPGDRREGQPVEEDGD